MYVRKHLITGSFIFSFVAILALIYILKPAYESHSVHRAAIERYEKSFQETPDAKRQKEILVALANLYLNTRKFEQYLTVVRRLIELGSQNPSLLKDELDTTLFQKGLEVALHLWKKEKTSKQRQDDVLLFAEMTDDKKLLLEFFDEVLVPYDEAYAKGEIAQEELHRAISIAARTDKSDLHQKWLERGIEILSEQGMRDLFRSYLQSGETDKAWQLASQINPETTSDLIALAHLHMTRGDKSEAMRYYQEAETEYLTTLNNATDPQQQQKTLIALIRLYRDADELDKYLTAIKQLVELGDPGPELLEDALEVALHLWRQKKKNRERQEDVLFFAELAGNQTLRRDFLVWNNRLEEALLIYEAAYTSNALSQEDLHQAISIAGWTGKPKVYKQWLEWGLDILSDEERMELLKIYVALRETQKALQIAPRVTPKTPADLLLLANLYTQQNDKTRAKQYYKAVEARYLQQLNTSGNPQQKKDILRALARLYRSIDELDKYLDTVKQLIGPGETDPELLKDGLEVALHLWRQEKTNKQKQQDVLLFAELTGDQALILDFLIWNERYAEVFRIYEEKFRNETIADDELKRAMTTARWQNDPKLLKKWLERGVVVFPETDLLKELAILHFEDKEYKKAKKLHKIIIAREPDNKTTLEALAYIYQKEGDSRQAYAYYNRLYSNTGDVAYLEGMRWSAQQLEAELYKNALQELAKVKPTERNLVDLASLYVYIMEEYDKAVPILREIITKWPNPEYHDLLGYALYKSGKIHDASKILENTPPEFLQPETVILLSEHYQETGKWREAATFVEKYVRVHPDNRRILDHLAYLYKRLGWKDRLKKLMLSWEEK